MAFKLKPLSAASFLLLLLLLQLTDGFNANLKEKMSNRKLLLVNGLDAKETVFDVTVKGKKVDEEGWELRPAPLGPDPLHHHGAEPKPRTP